MKTLVVFSHLRWKFVYQRPQHLLVRLAKHYQIIFVEEPVPSDSSLQYLLHSQVAPNVTVLVGHTAEHGYGFNDEQMTVMGPMVRNWLRKNVDLSTGYGVWFYTPQALPMKDVLAPEFIVFDVMDELSMFKDAPKQLKDRERELLRIADVVMAGGPSLYNAKKEARPDTICLPSSVDAAHYSPQRSEEAEAETHIDERLEHDIPHPRIGFFGVIDERLDIDLVAAIADADPHWHICMVGPVVKIDPATLPQRPNIHWLGQQDYEVLPQIVHTWDVCMMPFALNDSTKFISPTKTLEYMAAEKPVVSTDIHDVSELYGSNVEIGKTPAEFIAKIQMLLNESDGDKQSRLQRGATLVKHSSWDSTAEIAYQAIEAAILKKST
jgi:UDP-galactopyranose mutase